MLNTKWHQPGMWKCIWLIEVERSSNRIIMLYNTVGCILRVDKYTSGMPCIPIRKLPGAHKVVTTLQGCDNLVTTLSQPCHNLTRLSQPCHNLVIGLSVPYKVVTTLSQPCNRIVSTLQGCDNLVTTLY